MTRPPLPPGVTRLDYPDVPDADWQSLVDYLSGEGSISERELVQQRLISDSTFATFAAPVIRIWQLPSPTAIRDLDAGWAAVQRKAVVLKKKVAPAVSSTASPTRWPFFYSSSWSTKRSLATLSLALVATIITLRSIHAHRWPSYHYKGGLTGSTFTLPDGSIATLGPQSYLGTDPGFPKHNRTLHLFGTAHFTVVPNPRVPFIVYVPSVGAHVLGTTFAIQSDTLPQVHVNVTYGKVSLETQDAQGHRHQLAVLTAGQAQAIHILLLAQWMAEAGREVAMSGASMQEASHIEAALRRALIRAGAAAAASQARGDSVTR